MKRTSVVILNWNGAALLRRYLPIVVATSVSQDVDVVVADNASSDDSLVVLQTEFPTVKVIALDRNYGFAGGYNRALAQIDSEYVVLLNSDVATTPSWLIPLVSLMDSDNSIAACSPKILDDKCRSRFEYAGAAGGYIDWLGYPFCRGRIMDTVEEDNGQYNDDVDVLWGSGAALMVRRGEYIACGGLDEDFFAHQEEIDMCWRMRNRGNRVVACGSSGVYHLGGATLNSANPRKTYLNFRNSLTMMVKNYNSRLWPFVILFRLVLDGVAGLKFVAGGKFAHCWAIVRAHWAFFFSITSAIRKRCALKKGRSRSLVPEVKRYSLIVNYYLRGRKLFSQL